MVGLRRGPTLNCVVEIDSIVPDWMVAIAMRRDLETHFRIMKEKALAQAQQPGPSVRHRAQSCRVVEKARPARPQAEQATGGRTLGVR